MSHAVSNATPGVAPAVLLPITRRDGRAALHTNNGNNNNNNNNNNNEFSAQAQHVVSSAQAAQAARGPSSCDLAQARPRTAPTRAKHAHREQPELQKLETHRLVQLLLRRPRTETQVLADVSTDKLRDFAILRLVF